MTEHHDILPAIHEHLRNSSIKHGTCLCTSLSANVYTLVVELHIPQSSHVVSAVMTYHTIRARYRHWQTSLVGSEVRRQLAVSILLCYPRCIVLGSLLLILLGSSLFFLRCRLQGRFRSLHLSLGSLLLFGCLCQSSTFFGSLAFSFSTLTSCLRLSQSFCFGSRFLSCCFLSALTLCFCPAPCLGYLCLNDTFDLRIQFRFSALIFLDLLLYGGKVLVQELHLFLATALHHLQLFALLFHCHAMGFELGLSLQ